MVRAALGRLGRLTGTPLLDVFFHVALAKAMDPEELERLRLRRHVFLARYGYQSVLQWGDVDGRQVRRYAQALAELLNEESDAVKKAAAAAAAKG